MKRLFYLLIVLLLATSAAAQEAYINSDGVDVFWDPGGVVYDTVSYGQRVQLIDDLGDWSFVSVNGFSGYVLSAAVTPLEVVVEPELVPVDTSPEIIVKSPEQDFFTLDIMAAPELEELTVGQLEYQEALLTTLINIQGYMIFGVVVILCFFSYKFFRIFF